MIQEYIDMALQKAHYEMIEDKEPYCGKAADLQGVRATGRTLEECRKNLAAVIDGWVLIRLSRGLPIPEIGGARIQPPTEISVA